jgi:hypothetical protein
MEPIFSVGSLSGCGSIRTVLEQAKIDVLSVNRHVGAPFSRFFLDNAHDVVFSPVLTRYISTVLGSAHIAQIGEPIVTSVVIDMVDLACRPIPGHI